MPDDTGKLSTTEQEEVIEWIALKAPAGGTQCPLCRSKDSFDVGLQLVAPAPITPEGVITTGKTHQLVTLACRECFHVSFLIRKLVRLAMS